LRMKWVGYKGESSKSKGESSRRFLKFGIQKLHV
jgi:hypothetical protein